MESKRQQKISRLLQKDISEILQKESFSLTKGAMVTVTKVLVTRDLSLARIYLSIFAAKDKQEVIRNINDQKKELRFRLGTKVRDQLRKVPELEFFEDDSLDYIENIENLLKE